MATKNSGNRALISFDYAMKHLLRNKSNYEVLEGFLSVLLNTDVKVKKIGESESNKEHASDKYNKVDIFVENTIGEVLLIELQFQLEIDYLHRMLYGTSKTITEHMVRGKKYLNVKKVYSINIVYFDLGQGDDYVYHGKTHFIGLHKNDELKLSKAQRETFGRELAGDIYPEYYILKVNQFNDHTKDMLDEWIYFFKHNIIKKNFQAKGLAQARTILACDQLSPKEKKAYERLQDQRGEDRSAIASMRLEGEIEGREKERKKFEKERENFQKERENFTNKLKEERENFEKEREIFKEERKTNKKLLAEITRLKQK
jgi:predicted transposase/invertase (TIGR01784 family)